MTTDIETYRQRLEDRRAYLNRQLHRLEDALDAPAPADTEDRATERENDEVMEGLGTAGLNELRQIEAALDRIDHDRFGICQNCGETIATERLDLVPHASVCTTCIRPG